MKIKILHHIPGYAFFGGEVIEMADDTAAKWIVAGKALMIPDMLREMEPIKTVIHQEETIHKISPKKKK